jgi:G3E family GTPase
MAMPDAGPADARVPVNVLTGFLGSGKTTLLQRLLASPALADSAVIINELGEAGIDHHLIDYVDQEVLLLKNGCICCGMRGDLRTTLQDLLDRHGRLGRQALTRVIVETTGMADPVPLLNTLALDAMLRHQFRIGTVVATVDAYHGAAQLAQHPESVKQAAVADRIVITKTDLATPEALAALEAELAGLNRTAPRLRSSRDFDPALLALDQDTLSAGRTREVHNWFTAQPEDRPRTYHGMAVPAFGPATQGGHGQGVRTASLVFDRPLNWIVLGTWMSMLLHRHGDGLLRLKCLLNIEGSDLPTVVHGVHRLVHPPVHLDAWPTEDRRSRLVLIGDIPAQDALQASLERFLALQAQ